MFDRVLNTPLEYPEILNIQHVKTCQANVPFLYLLKTSGNQMVYDVFRSWYRKETFSQNLLINVLLNLYLYRNVQI